MFLIQKTMEIHQILKLSLNVLAFGAFISAFLIHLANKQSKSYFILFGYGLGCFAMINSIIQYGTIGELRWWFWSYFLLGIGEVVRFLKKEELIKQLLKGKSDHNLASFNFDWFKELPLNETVYREGRSVTKIKEDDLSISLLVKYKKDSDFLVEAVDYDLNYSIILGEINIEVLGKETKLKANDSLNIKKSYPFSIKALKDSTVSLIIVRR